MSNESLTNKDSTFNIDGTHAYHGLKVGFTSGIGRIALINPWINRNSYIVEEMASLRRCIITGPAAMDVDTASIRCVTSRRQ